MERIFIGRSEGIAASPICWFDHKIVSPKLIETKRKPSYNFIRSTAHPLNTFSASNKKTAYNGRFPFFPCLCLSSHFSKRQIGRWVQKAWEESQKGATVVALLPARTDTDWFHKYILDQDQVEIRFLQGRLYFRRDGGQVDRAPFPSMVVVFRPNVNVTQVTKKLTVNEVLNLFKAHGITDSAQIIRRWLREGKLKGIPPESRKAGWMIPQEEVERFIAERNPLYAENRKLRAEIARLNKRLEQLKAGEKRTSAIRPGGSDI